MSNHVAIAMMTATLRHLLNPTITGSGSVTSMPLDKARGSGTDNQLNLFLYQIGANAAWRNRDMPMRVQPNETGMPPMPLNLYYMITAYGKGDEDILGHRLLGAAMSILHDHPVLSSADIKAAMIDPLITAIDPDLEQSDLADQVERVRITWQPLSLEELSKLWGGFQTAYHLSAAYEASVVLLESRRASKTPLPILTRGDKDAGISAMGSVLSPFPELDGIVYQANQSSARPGETVRLVGSKLLGAVVQAAFRHPRVAAAFVRNPEAGNTDTQLDVKIPNDPAAPAGNYTVAVTVTPAAGQPRATQEIPFALSPVIDTITPGAPAVDGSVTITVKCRPNILPSQSAALLVADREITADPHPTATDTLTFVLTAPVQSGTHAVRLRVDGVDSILVDKSKKPPVFDTTQVVTL